MESTAIVVGTAAAVATRDVCFPEKLQKVLVDLEASGLSHIASYLPHGRAFRVYQLSEFVSNVLPLYFRQSKYASFQRQLNIYGFRRITSGPDKHAYFHERFLRDEPNLACGMMRMNVKGMGPRRPASPSTAPNFYATTTLQAVPNEPSPSDAATSVEQVARAAPVEESIGAPRTPQEDRRSLFQLLNIGSQTAPLSSQINGAYLSLFPSSLMTYPWCQNEASPQDLSRNNREIRGYRPHAVPDLAGPYFGHSGAGTGDPFLHPALSLDPQRLGPLALALSVHRMHTNSSKVSSESGQSNPTLALGAEQPLSQQYQQLTVLGAGSTQNVRRSLRDGFDRHNMSYATMPTPATQLAILQLYSSIGRSDDQSGRSTGSEGNQTFNGAFLGMGNGM